MSAVPSRAAPCAVALSCLSAALLLTTAALAQEAVRSPGTALDIPAVRVETRVRPRPAATRKRPAATIRTAARPRPARAARVAAAPAPITPALAGAGGSGSPGEGEASGRGGSETGGSLTVPSVAEERARVNSTVGSVAFVDAKSFENRYTNNITDTLKDTPGVFAQTRYGQEIRLSVRGSGIARAFHTRGLEILQDGIPFNLADGSGDYYQIDPLALRAIEVYKGGNALTFGAATLGGAINFVTPTAYTALSPAFVRLEGGSFGAMRENVQASAVEGNADALINLTRSHQDGYRDHANQDYTQLNANLGYKLAPGVETRFYVGAFLTRQKLPGTLDLTTALSTPRIANAAARAGNQSREVWSERIANRTSIVLDTGTLDLDSWYIHKNLYHPIFQVIDQDGATWGVAPHWSGTFDLGGHRNDLTVGARYFAGMNDALQFVNVAGNKGAATANARQTAVNYEAYLDERFWILPDVALMAGAKLFHDDRDFLNRFVTPNQQASRSYDGAVPKLGLLYQPLPAVQLFADVTGARDVPDFSDLAQSNLNGLTFVPLQQQRATTTEVGTRGTLDRLTWDITLYRSQIRDELINFNTNAALGIPAATFNAPRTRHQGVELGLGLDLVRDVSGEGAGDTISLSQTWTRNDFRFRHDPVYGNNVIAGIPADVLRTTLRYARPDGFYLAPALDWVPQGAFADHANTLRAPGYALLGLQTGITFGTGATLFIDARNLLDKRYISDLGAVSDARRVSTAVFYPGDGRSVFAGMRLTF